MGSYQGFKRLISKNSFFDVSHRPCRPQPVLPEPYVGSISEFLLWYNSLGPWDPGPEPVPCSLLRSQESSACSNEGRKMPFPQSFPAPRMWALGSKSLCLSLPRPTIVTQTRGFLVFHAA